MKTSTWNTIVVDHQYFAQDAQEIRQRWCAPESSTADVQSEVDETQDPRPVQKADNVAERPRKEP